MADNVSALSSVTSQKDEFALLVNEMASVDAQIAVLQARKKEIKAVLLPLMKEKNIDEITLKDSVVERKSTTTKQAMTVKFLRGGIVDYFASLNLPLDVAALFAFLDERRTKTTTEKVVSSKRT